MSLSTYSSPPHPLTQPPGCCGFINLHPRTSLLLRNRFTRVNSPPPSQGLRIWSFSRDGLWACRWAVRRVNLLFPPLHFFADLLSSLSEAVGMRALVCRSLPHAEGGSPRQLPHLPSKHSSKFRSFSRLHPSPPSLFPPSPPPPLHSLQLANSLVSSIPPQAVQSEYTEKFPPRREVEFYPAMPHCTTPLHCTVMQWTL